jgi:hypothetical protein
LLAAARPEFAASREPLTMVENFAP